MKWPEVEIGSLCRVARGGSPRPINQFMTEDDDGVNWIKISDATASGKVIRSTKERIKPEGLAKSRAVFAGDFLLSNSMSFGRPYLLEIDGAIHDGWLVLQDMSPRLDKAYLYEALQAPSVQSQFHKRASGTTVKNLNAEIVRTVKIPLPPLDKQKRIAGILDEADRVRKKTQALIDKYDELAQSLFLDMFGDPVTNPKGWETKTFADVITGMQNGIGKGKEFYGRGEKVANIGDLYKSCDFEPVKYSLLDVNEEEIAKYSLRFGDLLFVRSSLKKEGVAVCSFFNSKDTCLFSSFMIKASPDLSRLDPFFLSSQMRAKSYRKLLINAANTATITNISQPNLKRVPVIVPPLAIQKKFSNSLLELKREQQLTHLELKETDKLFNALLQKAFKGELT